MKMLRKWLEGEGQIVERLWFDVYHPEILDADGNKKSQGKVCLSFEMLPIVSAEAKQNSNGRDAPNNFPVLPEPVGRLSFDIMNPLQFIKDIIGPDLYRKCCTILFSLCFCLICGSFVLLYVAGKISNF